jgi:valyl-tRNA synthetase
VTDQEKNLPKRFDAEPAEARWYQEWLKRDLFTPETDSEKPPFSIVIPPPNVTGALHLGHALNGSLQDVLCRHKRMQGYNVLWLPGTDHAGIATQVVVERKLAEDGKTRHDLGREAFLEEVWKWKKIHGNTIIDQQKRLGSSCDWSRERFTMDEGLSKAVREVFTRLHHEGLIYRANYLVNWCPRCMTVLSDLEAPRQSVGGNLYKIRYDYEDREGGVEVETTRPETLLGDTAVAVHPEDERYRSLIGQRVKLPLTQRSIEIVADAFVDPKFGTGAVKVTPGHDPNDFECGRRLGLEEINLLHKDGTFNENAGEKYAGMDMKTARKSVLADLEALGLLLSTTPHQHEVPHCDRCRTVVEPLLSNQWFLKMGPLAKPAIEIVKSGKVKFHPKNWENTYFHWMENIRDWPISRQLWWGHRIPAWECGTCGEWTSDVDTPTACRACGGTDLTQDEDVLDTWFSSALWPFSTMGWPDQTDDLKTFYPTTVLSTGFDIIFFWVARMIFMALHFMDDVPFQDVYIHPLIRDAKGKKMSKTAGNGIDPLVVMEEHGTDALRYTLVSLAAQGRDIKLGTHHFDGARSFVTKIWNAARFSLMNLEDFDSTAEPGTKSLYDRWIRERLDVALKRMHDALDAYRFNDAADAIYHFMWHEFCDWYIELSKQTLQGEDQAARAATQHTLVETLSGALQALHPIMPYVTEEIYQALPHLPRADGRSDLMLMEQSYPAPAPTLSKEESQEMSFFTDLVTKVRQVRGELGLPPKSKIRIRLPKAAGSLIEGHHSGIRALTNAESLKLTAEGAPPEAASVTRAGVYQVWVELDDPSYFAEEANRLEKSLKKLEKDIAMFDKKLSNPKFLERAKPEVVAKDQAKLQGLREEA